MKNIKMSWILVFAAFISITISAQPVTKSKTGIYQQKPDGSGKPVYLERKAGINRLYYNNGESIVYHSSITEPVHFPFQNENQFYSESFPVILANGNTLMVWASSDSIYGAQSSDGGVTWVTRNLIAQPISGFGIQSLVGLRTNTGRVIVVWRASGGLEMCYSDNNGNNWSAPTNLTSNGSDQFTTISQSLDGTLWLFYNRFDFITSYDIYYRTSADDGNTWSSEQIFAQTFADEYYGTVVSGNDTNLLAVYCANSSGDYDIYSATSTDGGLTWSAPATIVNSSFFEDRPRVLRQSDGTLWMIYRLYHPAPTLTNFLQYDLYYTQSLDGGNSWTSPTEFTRYVQYDGGHNAVLLNNQPFVSFASYRWGPYLGWQHLWYGIIGVTQDTNPPPAVFGSGYIPASDSLVPIQAFTDDETGVSDAQLSYTVNGAPFGPVQMFDDGLHNDENPGDNIWGASVGPFQLGDFISYSFTVTDATANTVEGFANTFEIIAVHNVGNVILGVPSFSQLGANDGSFGSNAHWPRENGQDYLYDGGLWIGAEVSGENRVMNHHYSDNDWNQTFGSSTITGPGLSNQDISVIYDDQFAQSSSIGLQVHQQSYQWSDSTRDDFIIYKYTIHNTGLNGNLTDVFTAVWLDPDVSNWTFANDDLGGYDGQRNMIYMYDSQNNPGGYIGLKLLGPGNVPHTASIERPSFDDLERYQYMTSGIPPLPTNTGDWNMLLTAQPFNLAAGDSQTVAFGLVMGDGLGELQAHADTMQAIYNGIWVGIEDLTAHDVPTVFSLAQNYPNPFNPSTTIEFSLPTAAEVSLVIYNVTGQEVERLIERRSMAPGNHRVEWAPHALPSGVYFYRLTTGGFTQSRKMVLLK